MKLADYKKIAPALDKELEAALAKFGLKMNGRTASIQLDGSVKIILKARDENMKAADGSATTPEAEFYKGYAESFGLKPEWLGTEITFGRRAFAIAGLKNTRSEKCVVITSDGKQYVATVEQVQRAKGTPPSPPSRWRSSALARSVEGARR